MKILKTFLLFSFIFLFLQSIKAQWIEQYSGDTVNFKSVSAVDNNIAWISGDVQRVYRTTNGGTNWVRRSSNGIPYPLSLSNVFGVDENVALVAGTFNGDRTFVFRTSNGGASWVQVFSQQNGFINSIWMNNGLEGFMQGDPVDGRWSLWRTSNGGITWDSTGVYLPSNGDEYGYVNTMYITSENQNKSIWFGTDNFRVYHSSNYGSSWNIQATPNCQYIQALWFNDISNGMIGGSGIYSTSNGGLNWNFTSNMISTSGITGEGNKWWNIQSYGSNIYFSSNNGVNWVTQFQDTSIQFVDITIPRAHTKQYNVWAVGNPGKIFKFNSTVGIIQNNIAELEGYYLSQNYPNPFNPSTSISYRVPKNAFVKIELSDILGKIVSIILNEFKIAGSYTIDLDGSKLKSGIYFYKIESLNFTQVKKMVVIK